MRSIALDSTFETIGSEELAARLMQPSPTM